MARCSYRKVCPHSEVEEVTRTLDTELSLDVSPRDRQSDGPPIRPQLCATDLWALPREKR